MEPFSFCMLRDCSTSRCQCWSDNMLLATAIHHFFWIHHCQTNISLRKQGTYLNYLISSSALFWEDLSHKTWFLFFLPFYSAIICLFAFLGNKESKQLISCFRLFQTWTLLAHMAYSVMLHVPLWTTAMWCMDASCKTAVLSAPVMENMSISCWFIFHTTHCRCKLQH